MDHFSRELPGGAGLSHLLPVFGTRSLGEAHRPQYPGVEQSDALPLSSALNRFSCFLSQCSS